MNTREKIDMADDASRPCIHKEEIFYKLYNQQAMLFTENIKPLKIKPIFIKAVNQQGYSCGFHASIIEEIKKQQGPSLAPTAVRTDSVFVALRIG